MEILNFLKEAGEKIFGSAITGEDTPNKKAEVEVTIFNFLAEHRLKVGNLAINFDENTSKLSIAGVVPDQETYDKIIWCCRNIQGVADVDNQLEIEEVQDSSEQEHLYTVMQGDTLSKIASEFYGDSSKYMVIFHANTPMLENPDRIYPGQILRIPSIT